MPNDHAADEELQCIVADLRRYFRQNPRAADTVRGVKIWLARQRLHLPANRVRQALRVLMDEGLVAVRESHEGNEKDVFFLAADVQPCPRARLHGG